MAIAEQAARPIPPAEPSMIVRHSARVTGASGDRGEAILPTYARGSQPRRLITHTELPVIVSAPTKGAAVGVEAARVVESGGERDKTSGARARLGGADQSATPADS